MYILEGANNVYTLNISDHLVFGERR